jgi:hypothetical protein
MEQGGSTYHLLEAPLTTLFLIDQGHSSQNQVRNPLHIQMSLIVLYKCS